MRDISYRSSACRTPAAILSSPHSHTVWNHAKVVQEHIFRHKISFFQVQILENVESPVNSMSIGLLFGVSLLHLIPDANEDMENALERAEADTNYPVAMLLVAVGFFIVTLVEIVVSNCSSKVSTRDTDGPSLFWYSDSHARTWSR